VKCFTNSRGADAARKEGAEVEDQSGNDLLIINARLIDGTGAGPQKGRSILIREGRIVEIGEMQSAEGARVLDLAGATVLPGIIDAHVHLQSVPGSMYRQDSEQEVKEQRYHQLKAYAACGVTTVLDNLIAAPVLNELHDHLEAGHAGPRVYAVGPGFYPPDGYLDHGLLSPQWGPHFGPASDERAVQALFEEFADCRNIVGVKVLLEPGFGASPVWPILSPEIRKVIMREAGKRGLPIYAHAYNSKMQAIALDMDVHNLAHAGFLKKAPSKKFIQAMKDQGAYVTTTLASTLEQMLIEFQPERLDDPLLQLTVPQNQLDTARDPQAWKQSNAIMLKTSAPKWMPDALMNFITKKVNMQKQVKACVESSGKAIKLMHEEGIPVCLGTDTSNWPLFLGFFHGPSTVLEMELLGRAGLAPLDVITAATQTPARMMGLADELGTIDKGKHADMIVVRKDPLEDMAALRNLEYTIMGGKVATPEEWIKAA
jgi:imidazolonepropionase-like amidohydrolase